MVVKCNVIDCYWNKGNYCSRVVTVLNNGACSQLVDKNGVQRNPILWQHPEFDEEQVDEQTTEAEDIE